MDAIQGSVPGVQIVSSGAPGQQLRLFAYAGLAPLTIQTALYVVDGMFVGDINFLNPNDIAEISVLKDASGAAYLVG